MNLIASADRNWAIGLNNKLLIRIPEDMKFFRRMDYKRRNGRFWSSRITYAIFNTK